jgi:dTMP kinase
MTGKLITLEGPEGGGKSTQAAALAEALRGRGFEVLLSREPGGTPTGEIVRKLIQHNLSGEALAGAAEVLLFCASRAQLCANVIRPALERGVWVVLDRFTDSTLAYQGYGRGFDVGALRLVNDFATGGLVPDLTLLIDIPAAEGLARAAARAGGAKDTIEREPLAFHERLRAGYLAVAESAPCRIAVIDGSKTAAEVAEAVGAVVGMRFPSELQGLQFVVKFPSLTP